jgi:hypothetical protein
MQSVIQQFEGIRLDIEPHLLRGGLRAAHNVRCDNASAMVRPGFAVVRRLADNERWPIVILEAVIAEETPFTATAEELQNQGLTVVLHETNSNGYSMWVE